MTDAFDQPLDDVDVAILEQLRVVRRALDPPPADLDDRVRFAIALEDVEIEVARLQEDVLVGSGARATERTRTVTFDCDRMTIMISVVDLPEGLIRLDGWFAPPDRRRVELRLEPAGSAPVSWDVMADEDGRFVFQGIGRGLAQLLVHHAQDGGATVVTPSIVL
jgi:hypothetical protein